MGNRNLRRAVYFLCLIAAVSLGCKKKVAAAPSTAASLQPVATPPAPEIMLRAAPDTIDQGEATSLQWEAVNATNVNIQPELGSVRTQGSQSVRPASSITYTATAIGPGGAASASARITVRVPDAAASSRPEPPTNIRSIDDLFRQNVQTIYFDFDKSDIRQDQISRLEANAAWLKEHRGLNFTIEGNCDERGSEKYNQALGNLRANRVKEFLIKEGIDASRIRTISYGGQRPVCYQATEDCYQKNRRVSFAPIPAS
jgi:peptidoglycan-associated lipoprotein